MPKPFTPQPLWMPKPIGQRLLRDLQNTLDRDPEDARAVMEYLHRSQATVAMHALVGGPRGNEQR